MAVMSTLVFFRALLAVSTLVLSANAGVIDSSAINLESERFEYVIVGSGAGGGTLAARLALNGKKVLLIEAGDDQGESESYQVPVFHAHATEDPKMSWDFFVDHYDEPERAKTDSKFAWERPGGAFAVGKKHPGGEAKAKGILYPRTGTLGGCTAHNAMVNVYPHASDWNHIVNITGDRSWEAEKMRKLFVKMERADYLSPGAPGHGFDGWLAVNEADNALAANDMTLLNMGVETANYMTRYNNVTGEENLNQILSGDMNSADPKRDASEGVWKIPLALNKGKRAGSRDFIMEVLKAKHPDGRSKYPLTLAMDTFVTKILFAPTKTGEKPRATGVEFLKGKSIYRADRRAKDDKAFPRGEVTAKEVIISGGAFNTPQILKLSGIGSREELAKFNIPLVAHLPGVGTNLQDHFEIGVTHEIKDTFSVVDTCTFTPNANDPCVDSWKKGVNSAGIPAVYGQSNGFVYGIIKKSTVAHEDTVYGNDPDLLMFGGIAAFRGYYPGYAKDVYKHNTWTWVVLKAHSGNRAGTVKLASADPRDTPLISMKYFDTGSTAKGEDKRDLKAMSEAVEICREINKKNKDPLTNEPVFTEVLPGREKERGSKALEDHIKAESWSHHASCTAPIGADDDPMAVLDSKFRVRGVEGLRVVDASVFPRVPGFFIALPTYMIGEKAAETILEGR